MYERCVHPLASQEQLNTEEAILGLVLIPLVLTGLLNGCAAHGQGGNTTTRQGATGIGSMQVVDEPQRDPTLKGKRSGGPAYNEGQRSQALEGNTR